MSIAFLLVAVILLAFETHHQALYAGCLGIGFLAAAVAAFSQKSLIVDGTAFGITVVACLLLLRPYIKRILDRRTPAMQAFGVHIALIGQSVITDDEVGDEHHPGHAQLGHERWLAISLSDAIPPGTNAIVKEVRGTTLVIELKQPVVTPE